MTRHIIMYGCEDVKAKIKSKLKYGLSILETTQTDCYFE